MVWLSSFILLLSFPFFGSTVALVADLPTNLFLNSELQFNSKMLFRRVCQHYFLIILKIFYMKLQATAKEYRYAGFLAIAGLQETKRQLKQEKNKRLQMINRLMAEQFHTQTWEKPSENMYEASGRINGMRFIQEETI